MESIILDAHGKINLSLDVVGERIDGYHEIETIMQSIDLKDTLVIKNKEEGITIDCNAPNVPTDSRNLVHKAYSILSDTFNLGKGAYVNIHKRIPVAAGLAGGSTDAAVTLIGLNQLWGLNLSINELMSIGLKIGADVPFCLLGGTALAKGVGEKLTSLNSFKDHLILLANLGLEVSTAHVYNSLNIEGIKNRPDMGKILKAIGENDLITLSTNMVNVLEEVTIGEYPQIGYIKDEMLKWGALGTLMSGSGPTVLGFFEREEDLNNCKYQLEGKVKKLIVTKTI